MAILTDKGSAPEVTLSDLVHIVDTSDTTATPFGTSKKASVQQLRDLITTTVNQFTELIDTPSGYVIGDVGKVVQVNATYDGLEFATPSGGGSTTFSALTDTPANYTGSAGFFVTVNSTPDALQYVNPSSINLSIFNNDSNFVASG